MQKKRKSSFYTSKWTKNNISAISSDHRSSHPTNQKSSNSNCAKSKADNNLNSDDFSPREALSHGYEGEIKIDKLQ